jgi:uncharacterized membrane protein
LEIAMKRFAASIALVALVVHGTASAQRNTSANSLERALATFTAADQNKDGKLSTEEVAAIPIGRSDFQAHDYDHDGSWSKDEFLVFYRQRLLLAGQQVGAELEAETARVQALRKTKAAEETKQKREEAKLTGAQNSGAAKASQPTAVPNNTLQRTEPAAVAAGTVVAANAANAQSSPQPNSPQASNAANIEAGLQAALDQLEKRAAAGQATREDFQRVRDQLIARARAAASSGAAPDAAATEGSDAFHKMQQALDRLEKRAAEGVYSRDEYRELRDTFIHRARLAAKSGADAQGQTPAAPDPSAITTGLQNAIDDLEQRAAAGHATREDFQRVRDQLIARARAAASGAHAQDGVDLTEGSDAYQKMTKALERLEKRAAEGGYSREEYQELRALFIHRAREMQNATPASPNGATARPTTGATPVDTTTQPATPKPADAGAPPAQPVPTARPAPAPTTEPATRPAPPRTPPPQPAPATGNDASKPQRPVPPPENPPKNDAQRSPSRPPQ